METYRVQRSFSRHDGTALKKYVRGDIIRAKEAAKISSWSRLVGAGFVQLIPTEIKFSPPEVIADGEKDY